MVIQNIKSMKLVDLLGYIKTSLLKLSDFKNSNIQDYNNVISLFDSIYRNYPIGHFIICETDDIECGFKNISIQIDDVDRKPIFYLLDGESRLSLLYTALMEKQPNNLKLHFNVKTETFEFTQEKKAPYIIPVDIMTDVSYFRRYFKNEVKPFCASDEEYEEYFDAADDFSYRLNKYRVPVIEIENVDTEQAKTILNNIEKKV